MLSLKMFLGIAVPIPFFPYFRCDFSNFFVSSAKWLYQSHQNKCIKHTDRIGSFTFSF